jgi:phenylpyruvate tautomerase PptA (4-oxalocrotonate tautomerase family)
MPIFDVRIVTEEGARLPGLAQRLADALGRALGSPPGRVWVRIARIDAGDYAENEASVAGVELPVFLTILHADPPEGEARSREVLLFARAASDALGLSVDRIHIEYAPAGRGRVAFGGKLLE